MLAFYGGGGLEIEIAILVAGVLTMVGGIVGGGQSMLD